MAYISEITLDQCDVMSVFQLLAATKRWPHCYQVTALTSAAINNSDLCSFAGLLRPRGAHPCIAPGSGGKEDQAHDDGAGATGRWCVCLSVFGMQRECVTKQEKSLALRSRCSGMMVVLPGSLSLSVSLSLFLPASVSRSRVTCSAVSYVPSASRPWNALWSAEGSLLSLALQL